MIISFENLEWKCLEGFKPRHFLSSSCEVDMIKLTLILGQPHTVQCSHRLLGWALLLLTLTLAQLKDRSTFIAGNSLTV